VSNFASEWCSSVVDENFKCDFQQCESSLATGVGWTTTSMPADGRCARKGAQPRPSRAQASSILAAGGARADELLMRVRPCWDACTEGRRGQGLLSTSRACAPTAQGHDLPPRGSHQGGVGSRGILVTLGGQVHILGDLTLKIGWRSDGMA
jgi:hypothetical protein